VRAWLEHSCVFEVDPAKVEEEIGSGFSSFFGSDF
jgi:hypothetical protein